MDGWQMLASAVRMQFSAFRAAAVLFVLILGAGAGRGHAEAEALTDPSLPQMFQASSSDAIFQHLTVDNGLANTVATCFAEDGDGFLWVGSQSGLQRWDGYRFWTYKQVLGSMTSLPDNLVQALYTDSQGRLWVGTSSGGLAMYDRREDRFVRYRRSPNDLNRVNLFSITGDGGRGLWIGSDTGLDHLDTDSGVFTHVELALIDGQKPLHANTIVRENDGTLWVGTEQGLERSIRLPSNDLRKAVFQTVTLPMPKGVANEVTILFRDRSARIWVGTPRGAYVIEQTHETHGTAGEPARQGSAKTTERATEKVAGLAKVVSGRGPGSEMLVAERYLTIAQASDGEMWFGTQDDGILTVKAEGSAPWEVHRIVHDNSLAGSLSDDAVQALYLGRPEMMWVGTRHGVSYLDTAPKGIFTMLGGAGRNSVIRDSNVYSVLGRRDGSVWLAMGRQGIDILDASGQKAAEIQTGTDPLTTLPPGTLTALIEAGDGSILVTTQRGLYRATPVTRPGGKQGTPRVTQVQIGSEAGKNLKAVLPDAGKLWIGGDNGLWLFDGNGPAKRPELRGTLSDQRVTVMMRGDEGSIWIGTQNGLNLLNPAKRTVEAILPDPADPRALGGAYISSLLKDQKGRLWVGTFSGGIDVLDGRDSQGRARFHRIIDGLPNENIDQLLETAGGRIWASTDGGLAVINPETYEMQVLHQADGAMLPAYWNGSGAITARGELVFGGIGGVTVVRPDLVKSWHYQPSVVVTNARIGDVDLPPSRFNSGLEEYPVWIPPDQNNLTVGFTALDYTAPDRNRYEYKLDGFDKDWVVADATRRLARYTNLPPGNYVLELRGSNRDGAWAPTRLVRVRVLPAWFQTWWFKVLMVLLVLLLLYVLFLLTTAYLRRQQRVLERQVALRTAELEQMTVELKDSQQKLEHMAYTDALTGLPNRRMFTEHFKRLLALKRRQGASFSLLLMDFDAFKVINDTYGHDAGDFVLVEMAARLSALVRESDCLARLGGDEFGLILGQSHDFEGTESVCRKIVESFEAPTIFEGQELRTAPSIGIAIYPFDGETQDKLYKAADLAMYQAKRNGGNGCSWSEQLATEAEARQSV